MNHLDINKIHKNISKDAVRIATFKEIDSTNDQCKRDQHDQKINVNIAHTQTNGRGRRGKSWTSKDYENIYMSISGLNIHKEKFPISLATGIICQKAIKSLANNIEVGLKWPNDIVLKNKKIGGILVEKEILGSNVITIVGIGINMRLSKKEDWWGDLSEFKELGRNDLINRILIRFLDYLDKGFINPVKEWENVCMHMNKEILISQNNEIVDKGLFKGIDIDGSLILENNDQTYKYQFGEVSIKGAY